MSENQKKNLSRNVVTWNHRPVKLGKTSKKRADSFYTSSVHNHRLFQLEPKENTTGWLKKKNFFFKDNYLAKWASFDVSISFKECYGIILRHKNQNSYLSNYSDSIEKALSTISWAILFGSEDTRLKDGHGESMCQGVLHWEQNANWHEVQTTAWLRWLREIDSIPKNFLLFFLWGISSVKVHTVSQPGRGHHISLGFTATSGEKENSILKQTTNVIEECVILPVLSCSLKYNGKTSFGTSCLTLLKEKIVNIELLGLATVHETYFITCQLTDYSLLVEWTTSIWTTNRDIPTSYTAVGIHFHALENKGWVTTLKFDKQNLTE